MVAGGRTGVGTVLEQAQAQRRGALREGLGDGSVGQVEGGFASPELERLVESGDHGGRLVAG